MCVWGKSGMTIWNDDDDCYRNKIAKSPWPSNSFRKKKKKSSKNFFFPLWLLFDFSSIIDSIEHRSIMVIDNVNVEQKLYGTYIQIVFTICLKKNYVFLINQVDWSLNDWSSSIFPFICCCCDELLPFLKCCSISIYWLIRRDISCAYWFIKKTIIKNQYFKK